jgi:hypothetical protein
MAQLTRQKSAEDGAEGKTYPQEGPMTFEQFDSYFFQTASSTIIGILHDHELKQIPTSLEEARGERTWEECVGGCNYMYETHFFAQVFG